VLLSLALDAALLAAALGGARALADPRALALLGVWAVAGVTLGLLRPVRAQDMAERRPDAVRMIALLVLPLVTPAVGALGGRLALAPLPAAGVLAWAGPALVAAGLALRIAAMARLRDRFSPLVALQREHVLERGGPYAAVRHPGYAGALLASAGAAITFGSAFALPLVVAFGVLLAARIRDEERLLRARFGAEWDAYAHRTGALLPRPGPRAGAPES
jgi:protein-S-isoprenylcysteine O-methyltransferase Ste14